MKISILIQELELTKWKDLGDLGYLACQSRRIGETVTVTSMKALEQRKKAAT